MSRVALLVILALAASVPTMAQTRLVSTRPDGGGDPDATTCRTPQTLPGSRFLGPEVCKLNSQWALLRKNGQDISADGSKIIADPKGSNITGQCTTAGGNASAGGVGMPVCH